MHGFLKHNIKHTSASSINMFAEAPDAWIAKYILGAKFAFSPAARAGVLAEDAVVNVLARGMSEEDATQRAIEEFARATIFDNSEKTGNRGDGIPGMIKNALDELKQYGEPEFDEGGKQKKVEINCRVDDWTIPVIGYLDLDYPQHGLTVDIKTTMRMPSKMSKSHLRQHGIYKASKGGNNAVKFLYVTPKKATWFEPEDTSKTLVEIKGILRRQNNLLQIGDAETLKAIVPVLDSFYWADDLQQRREIYGY
jgi:hypothetical protein